MHRFRVKSKDENEAEYKKIKGNFLEAIRDKIYILRKTLNDCDSGCKEDCSTHYHGLYGGQNETTGNVFTKFMEKIGKSGDGKSDDDKTSVESDDESGDDKTPKDTYVSKIQDLYNRIKSTPEEKRNTIKEKFCKEFFESPTNKGRYGFPLHVCSLDRISSSGTQNVCKLAIDLESDIKDLFKMYKSDVVHDDVAKLRSEFLKLSKTPTAMGGSKTKRRFKKR